MSNLLHLLQVTENPERHVSLVTAVTYLLSYSYSCHRAKVPSPPIVSGCVNVQALPRQSRLLRVDLWSLFAGAMRQ